MPGSTRVVLSLAVLLPASATICAQRPTAPPARSPKHIASANNAAVSSRRSLSAGVVTALPVTRVSLYKNGVGFFEHTGRVTGNAQVTLDFTTSQLDDVLQSLTAIDLSGGRISGADYNSTTPLDQQLKSLALGLGPQTSFSDLFAALHGTRVEVTGSGAAFQGRIVDIEAQDTTVVKDSTVLTSTYFLTLASDTGTIRIFQVTPALSVRLLDTAAHTDLTQYLQLLDSTRNQALRHLTLTDNGTGPRTLQLSYISEVPIWKSTYRILFTDPISTTPTTAPANRPTATLQGWSVVDNTTGADWINVHLSLIAGAPDSFIQPLSQPIYGRRPVVPIAQQAQLTPQTHDSALDMLKEEGPPPAATAMMSRSLNGESLGQGSGHGVGGGFIGGIAGGYGIGPGSGGNIGGGVFHLSSNAPVESYEIAAANSLAPSTTTAAFDDFFAYNLTQPVTILKNQSALVPILQASVPAERVTLVSSNGFVIQQPLRALWITNTSGLTLDRGSFTIVEDGSFGGQGLLDPIHPDEKRLLSYAADQAVHVSMEGNRSTQKIESITASKGVLELHQVELHEVTYVIHNAAAQPRTIVLEEPVVHGFILDSESENASETPGSSDPKPVETTPTVYRFRVTVAPGGTARLHSGAKRRGTTIYQLALSNDNQLEFILSQTGNNPQVVAALQPILEARRRVADAQTAVDQTNARLNNLRSDEDRQRANITALQNADKSSRERFVSDLNHTEDSIALAEKDLVTRTSALDSAKADLSSRIESFHLDEAL